jgi:hypothetical protein
MEHTDIDETNMIYGGNKTSLFRKVFHPGDLYIRDGIDDQDN